MNEYEANISIRLGSRHCDETKDQHKIHIVCNLVCFAVRWKLGLEMVSLAAGRIQHSKK